MKEHILLIAGLKEGKELKQVLEKEGYELALVTSVDQFNEMKIPIPVRLVILDLDLPMVSNYFVAYLKKKTMAWILGISSQKFHPQLEEALRSDLFGVVRKPIDYSELFYCMKCVNDDKELGDL